MMLLLLRHTLLIWKLVFTFALPFVLLRLLLLCCTFTAHITWCWRWCILNCVNILSHSLLRCHVWLPLLMHTDFGLLLFINCLFALLFDGTFDVIYCCRFPFCFLSYAAFNCLLSDGLLSLNCCWYAFAFCCCCCCCCVVGTCLLGQSAVALVVLLVVLLCCLLLLLRDDTFQ